MSHSTCLLMDHVYITYAVLRFVFLLYIQLNISCFDRLCFTRIIIGFFIPVCDVREYLVCFLLVSGLGDTEGYFYWIFATTLTNSPVYCLSQTSPPSSLTTLTALRPLNYQLPPSTSSTTDFLVCCCVDPRLLASNLLLALCLHL